MLIIHSDYDGLADRIDSNEPILKGSIHHLERDEDTSNRPIVIELARLLGRLCGE